MSKEWGTVRCRGDWWVLCSSLSWLYIVAHTSLPCVGAIFDKQHWIATKVNVCHFIVSYFICTSDTVNSLQKPICIMPMLDNFTPLATNALTNVCLILWHEGLAVMSRVFDCNSNISLLPTLVGFYWIPSGTKMAWDFVFRRQYSRCVEAILQ